MAIGRYFALKSNWGMQANEGEAQGREFIQRLSSSSISLRLAVSSSLRFNSTTPANSSRLPQKRRTSQNPPALYVFVELT